MYEKVGRLTVFEIWGGETTSSTSDNTLFSAFDFFFLFLKENILRNFIVFINIDGSCDKFNLMTEYDVINIYSKNIFNECAFYW